MEFSTQDALLCLVNPMLSVSLVCLDCPFVYLLVIIGYKVKRLESQIVLKVLGSMKAKFHTFFVA